jgi:hypothetical protein
MPRMIDQLRASKLPSNMMQFAAKGALSVPPDENIEILVYLAKHNKVFGELARITLAGWDEKASLAAVSNPKTPGEVLQYFVAPENLRPTLLPALLENPSVASSELARIAQSASRDTIAMLLKSARVRASKGILETLRSNPYLKGDDASAAAELLNGLSGKPAVPPAVGAAVAIAGASPVASATQEANAAEVLQAPAAIATNDATVESTNIESTADQEAVVSAYLAEHAAEIAANVEKPFQPVGGIMDLLGADYFPVSAVQDLGANPEPPVAAIAVSASAAAAKPAVNPNTPAAVAPKQNSMQKINGLDVKGRIQLALKGNKEERSLLIRDGTKVVALAVLEAPKLTDGEVEKFALQKNVLEAVLRYIPLKRRFMKNYIVVRNLVANPRTPLDLGLGLMKHLLINDLKNLSCNKEVSETVRKLAMKMFKQKQSEANKK